MPLENSCEKYKGGLVFVLPGEGYGWCRVERDKPRFQPGIYMEPPLPFHARVLEFHYFHGEIRAGIGIVEQQGHPLNKGWVAFCVRDGMGNSTHNFTDNPAQYNIGLGEKKPIIKIDPEKLAMPEWMQFEDSSHLSGLGYIVDSEISLQDIYERIKKAKRP